MLFWFGSSRFRGGRWFLRKFVSKRYVSVLLSVFRVDGEALLPTECDFGEEPLIGFPKDLLSSVIDELGVLVNRVCLRCRFRVAWFWPALS